MELIVARRIAVDAPEDRTVRQPLVVTRQGLQRLDAQLGDTNHALACLGLHWPDLVLGTHPDQGPLNAQCPSVKINIGPRQAECLADPEPARRQHDEQWRPTIPTLAARRKERRCLLYGPIPSRP